MDGKLLTETWLGIKIGGRETGLDDQNMCQVRNLIGYQEGRFLLNWLIGILAKTRQAKDEA